jgi:hypothetical protein
MELRPALLVATAVACGESVPDRELFVQAQEPGLAAEAAVALCAAMEDSDEADACVLALLRAGRALPEDACTDLHTEAARGECWFLRGEQRAAAGDRWGALEACGQAVAFVDECLYHAWTRELQAVARDSSGLPAALEAAEEPIAYWSQLETAGPAQPERVWGDFWYFWWHHHPPASLQACTGLPAPLVSSCEHGTRLFVERSVDQALRDPAQAALLDRACRAQRVPERLLAVAAAEPALAQAGADALVRLCEQGSTAPRPWNPVFQPRVSR